MKKVLFITGTLMMVILANAQVNYIGRFTTSSGNESYHQFTRQNGGAAVYINQVASSTYPILRLSSGTETPNQNVKFTFENNGSFGIGTTSPTEKLEVAGNILTHGTLKLRGEFGNLVGRISTIEGYGSATDYLVFSANNGSTQHMKIGSNGNVAIGSEVTAQELADNKLSVDGTIKAEEIIVENVGADFVFEDGYDLRSLEEVENFINENNHLPGVAPASETTQGIKVSEFNTMLLQKIEELTLYMIELKKENEQLKSDLEDLKN